MGCQAGFGTCGYSDSSSSSPSGTASPSPTPSGGSGSAVIGTATSTVASTLSTTTPEPTCAVNSACTVDLVELQTTKELNTPCGGAANKKGACICSVSEEVVHGNATQVPGHCATCADDLAMCIWGSDCCSNRCISAAVGVVYGYCH